jgi:GDP-mannose 6-dehydrogenase
MKPGFAFGGSCLPKDVKALIYKGKTEDLDLPLTNAIMSSNRSQIERAVDWVLQTKKRKVAILGISFKAGTDDLRESPLVTVTERLIGKGMQIKIYDNNVSIARLVGANKAYIEKEIPHISSLMVSTVKEAVEHGDVLIIGNGSAEFKQLTELCKPNQQILDLAHIPELADIEGVDYHGVVW